MEERKMEARLFVGWLQNVRRSVEVKIGQNKAARMVGGLTFHLCLRWESGESHNDAAAWLLDNFDVT
jgi:hypothetical protein